MSYALVRMEASHLDEVLAIERASYEHPWTRNAFEVEMARDPVSWARVALTAEEPARVAGYCVAWILFEHLHIQNLAVHPDHRRRGLGRFLLVRALEEGSRERTTTALLEVRRSNHAAQNLYRNLGFREMGSRKDYYSQPREDALVFQKDLTAR
ncbi:MAG: ribosomal protein S18-alanine N-acetyltransferase [Vicinamibacteria bacterium]